MLRFDYSYATDAKSAIELAENGPDARFLGGGTNLVDLMRETIERPRTVVDVTGLSGSIALQADESLLVGAAATNTALAENRLIRERYPMLARAVLAGASAQIRNMATVGGNLLQRTRCLYFYDQAARCNKRLPGPGCDARDGFTRMHAILGASENCVATHPSDMCVALTALDAVVHIQGLQGVRQVPIGDFHLLPGDTPQIETVLKPAELVTAIELPAASASLPSTYRKVRDRSSYAFALVSVAAGLEINDDRVSSVRLALGGVALKPWRARKAEAALSGTRPTQDAFRAAARAELADAQALRDNKFKIELAERTIVAVLEELAK